MKIRSCLRGIALWVVALTLTLVLSPMLAHAACEIVETTPDGVIIVCDGPDADGVASGDGSDIITIYVGTDVSQTDVKSVDATATATATTISAQGGDDQITNDGSIRSTATLSARAIDVAIILEGSDEEDASITGYAVATGIDSGTSNQKDLVTNNGGIDVAASSNVVGGQIQLDLIDLSKADATLTADATATGIKGTNGNEIVNNSTITVTSTASVTAWTGTENVEYQATGNTPITSKATATGIAGGDGYNKITNAGVISVTANAEAYANSLELNALDAAVVGAGVGGSAEDPMKSVATGISAGDGGSEIVNTTTGKITANANSTVNIASVVLTLYDFTIAGDYIPKSPASAATHVTAIATGISGGSGSDIITNHGEISANANSLVMSESLGVGAEGVPSGTLPAFKLDYPLVDATIKPTSEAIGIYGEAGDDHIFNTGKITAVADTKTTAVGASVSFPLLELTELSFPAIDYPPAIAIAGAGTEGKASAWGIRGGEGNDTISNNENPEAIINVNATSTVSTTQASIALQNLITAGGGAPYFANLDLTLANASTKAESEATGIDGEGGGDSIENKGVLNVKADSTAIGNAASVAVEGLKGMTGLGVAIVRTKVGTDGIATAIGITGGEGDDEIHNTGQLNVDANSLANSLSANVSVQGEMKGVGIGVAFADATTTSTAIATGISGADGEDFILSGGNLHAYATSEAYAETFSVVVQPGAKGVEIGGALAVGTTTAIGTATGMDGGAGVDTLLNQGFTDVKATATANTLGASVDVQGSVKGVGVGVTFINTTTETETNTTGISGGEGNDVITNKNTGTLKINADSNTYAEQFAVTVQGEGTGAEFGGALALGTTTTTATATGINSGEGDDWVQNDGVTDVKAAATTNNLAVAVDVQGSVKGLGVGVAFTDASSAATTKAIGISGGEGDDSIQNRATGTIKAYAESDAYSELVSANVQGSGTGVLVGGAIALAGSTGTADAIGVDGGAGVDTLLNQGLTDVNALSTANSLAASIAVQGQVTGLAVQGALTVTDTNSTATAIGISGGDSQDTVSNSVDATVKSYATAKAYAESISVSVQGNATGLTLAGSVASGTTKPTASATGISGGEGDDILINQGLTDVKAVTDSTSVSAAVRAVGVIEGVSVGASVTDTSTTAVATAIGMDGGLDNDVIFNSGTIQANTDSTLRATSISIDFGGVPIGVTVGAALARASSNATGTAIGISGGQGDDTITNAIGSLIDVDSKATSTSTAVSISANIIGAAKTNTESTTLTKATGILGGEGEDAIANLGTIDVNSNATAKVASVSLNLIGAAPVSGWTSATANAAGIEGGLNDDWIKNEGTITAYSTSTTDATGGSLQIAGYSDMDVTTNAIANAIGIGDGSGDNTIYNTSTGRIEATVTNNADTMAVSINLLGYSKTDGSSTGASTAIGIAGGKEADTIQNEGTIISTATSDIDAASAAIQRFGYGEIIVKGSSKATVEGINGGDGFNTVVNMASITGTATALADASSYDIQLAGGGKGAAGTEATATALGITGGKDMDTIQNQGTINLSAGSTLVSSSRSYKIVGTGTANADSNSIAIAAGIDGGDGKNTIANALTGSITVSSNASATATGMTANIGVAGSSASTTSKAHSTGIKSGDGEDTIYNDGNMNVIATSRTATGGGSVSLVGLSIGNSRTEAITDGINAGGGKDTIINTGSITVGSVQDNAHPMAYSEVASVSFSFASIASATFGSKAQATGIIGGGGDDFIVNDNVITVGDDDWMAKGWAKGFSGNFISLFGLTNVGATAETIATGIDGGDGSDTLLNDTGGVLTVRATSYVLGEGAGDTTFGGAHAFASSSTKATATGISGGEGGDIIENKGAIDVYAHTLADAYTDSFAFWGSPVGDSTANATATAIGIDAGQGQNAVMNSGLMNVSALAEARPYAKANSDLDKTDAEVAAYSKSTALGIQAGDDDNAVNNTATGAITVTAMAKTYDAQGNIAKAESDEVAAATAGSVNSPITADAEGISLGKGDDTVTNDGRITVSSTSETRVSAYSNSLLYGAQSYVKTYTSAISKGIATGLGANEVFNNGQINVSAWSDSKPIVDSGSVVEEYIDATAGSTAVATGIEGEGKLTSTSTGDIQVKARATTYVDADSEAKFTTATAALTATATGIGTVGGETNVSDTSASDQIRNDGNLKVSALAGEDGNGNPQNMLYAKSNIWVYDSYPTGTGTSTVDAAGIRVGDKDAEIVNRGTMEVLAREHATLSVIAFSRDYNPIPYATSTGNATAAGIKGDDGAYQILNDGNVVVNGDANASSYSKGDTNGARYAWGNSTATANATTDGVRVGEGGNLIINNGSVRVVSKATADTDSVADAGLGSEGKATSTSTAVSDASGIRTGGARNEILNTGEITVKAWAVADAYAYADDEDFWPVYGKETPIATASTNAKAYGIITGDGNNIVVNKGTITVTAQTETKAVNQSEDDGTWMGKRLMAESATGIQTGSGDDTIMNGGKITASNQRLEWVGSSWVSTTNPGIAITSGAGNDQVFLMNGSETNGHIDLGEGNDRLTLMGSPLVTGNITGAAGKDSLVFEGAGSMSFIFSPTAFENAVKQGPGIYSVAGLPKMNRLEINQGTLEINSDYQFASDGTLETRINRRDHGQIKINGQAELDGNLNVIATRKRAYKSGETFDILTANNIVNEFSTVNLPSPKPLLSFDLHYKDNPDSVQVEAHTKEFTRVTKNSADGAIANYLDRIQPLANDDLSGVLGEIQNLSKPEEFSTAFSSLNPGSYDNYTRGTLFTAQQYAKSLQYRLNNVRSHIRDGGPSNEKPTLLAYSGSDASVSQLFTSGELSQIQGKSGLWLDAFGQWGDQDEEEGFTGYDYFMRGATLGFDHRLMDKLMAGLSLGYSRSDIDLDQDQGDGDVKSLFGSLYGSYFDKNLYIDAILSYGWNWYDNSRMVTIGGILREATSDHDGRLFAGYLGGGYYFDFNPLFVGPYGSLQYIYLDEESFEEEGAGGVSLSVDDRQTDALVSELGLRMVGRFKGKYGNFLPEVSLGWSYDFGIDDHVVRASFAGSPGASFSIEGQDVERNGLVVGAGLTFIHKSGFSTSFRYKGDFRGDYKSNAVMGEIRFSF